VALLAAIPELVLASDEDVEVEDDDVGEVEDSVWLTEVSLNEA